MSVALALRAVVVLLAGAMLCRALRPLSAVTRHALWRLTVVAVLSLPLATAITPAWSLLDLIPMQGEPLESVPAAVAESRDPAVGAPTWRAPAAAGPSALPTSLPTMLWLGTAAVGLYFLVGYAQLWRLRRVATPAPLEWSSAVERLSARSRVRRAPATLVASVRGPCLTGITAPAILLPVEALEWHPSRRDAILIHELAHLRRGDLLAQMATQAMVALHWFNPLAWYALREMRRERELACDEEVLRAGVAPIAYATELLAIASPGLTLALSMARPSGLEERVAAVLSGPVRSRAPAARAAVSLVIIVSSVVVSAAQVSRPAPRRDAIGAPGTRVAWTLPLGPGDDPPSADSAGLLSATDARVRERATAGLALSTASEAIPLLLKALSDADPRVREKAAIGLAWRRDGRVADALVAAAADPDSGVREKVLVALAFSGDARAAEIVDHARRDHDAGVRSKARTLYSATTTVRTLR